MTSGDPGEHPLTRPIYESLRRRGTAPPLPRDYGLRLISEVIRAVEHHQLLETRQEQT